MDKIPVELLCPICLDFPEQEAYQCGKGHLICSKCITNLQKCPQCLDPFEGTKIQNRVAESLLESYKLDCPHKHLGCEKKLLKDKLEIHAKICSYGGDRLNICKDFYINCEALVNLRDVSATIEHLKSHRHHEISGSSTTACFGWLRLLMLDRGGRLAAGICPGPIWFCYQDRLFIFKVICTLRRQLEISCFELSTDAKMEESKFQVEMIIRDVSNKGKDFKWTLPMAATMIRNGRLILPEFHISADLILKNYTNPYGSLEIELHIIKLPDKTVNNLSTPTNRPYEQKCNCVIL